MIRVVTLCFIAALVGCGKSPASNPENKPAVSEQAQERSKDGALALITPQVAQASGIEVLTAEPAVIRERVTLYGAIRSNAEREQTVRARYPGVVRTVTKRPGDRIGRGETLLTIESNDSLEPYTITSPMNGTVLERNVNSGENVDASMALFRIADLSTVWAEFTVFSRDLARIRPGLPIAIRTGDADLTVATTLSYVAATGHAGTQSVMARAQVANTNNRWIAGQFVTGEVVTSEVEARVAVAASAIQVIKNAPTVFVQTSKGFEPRVVKLGQHDRESVEIVVGVNAGDRYAGKNSYLIKADLLKSEADDE